MFHPCDIVDSFSTLNILVYLVKGFLSECLNIVLLELVLNVSVHEFSFNECDAFQEFDEICDVSPCTKAYGIRSYSNQIIQRPMKDGILHSLIDNLEVMLNVLGKVNQT